MERDDLIEVEFLIPNPVKVMATVRSRSGYYFGLAFLALQTSYSDPAHSKSGNIP